MQAILVLLQAPLDEGQLLPRVPLLVLDDLAPLDAVRVSPGTTRSFEAGPDGLDVLIFGPRFDGDAETVSDFWAS